MSASDPTIGGRALTDQTSESILSGLTSLSTQFGFELGSVDFASACDRSEFALPTFRSQFAIPKAKDIARAIQHGQKEEEREDIPSSVGDGDDSVYLCGNSLGLLPHSARRFVDDEMTKWSLLGVEGHFVGDRPWAEVDEAPTRLSMPVVGAALESEVAIMNSLSVNLHLLMTSFYRPTSSRFKILMESDAFCSDHHVIRSQVALHGRSVEDGLILLSPRSGEAALRTQDIIQAIQTHGETIALVLLPGIQFYTGQFFDIPAITSAGHGVGAYVGWDLAHAVGNVPLRLHDWNVDFAAWCSYKYLNSGPGSISGVFVHERHFSSGLPKLLGWWGQTVEHRFSMKPVHVEKPGAQSYMMSNPPVLPTVCLHASLEVHNAAGQAAMRHKSMLLTGYLEYLLQTVVAAKGDRDAAEPPPAASSSSGPITVRILTPSLPTARGCQLSLLFSIPVRSLHRALSLYGIVTDVREPNVIRVSPTPLYNTFEDVYKFVQQLKQVLEQFNQKRKEEQ